MEDIKPSNLILKNCTEIEDRFIVFCKNRLSLDDATFSEAFKLFKDSKHNLLTNLSTIGTSTPEEVERYWFAFVLYCVRRLSTKSDQTGVGLCQILRAVKLNLVDFFKELPQFLLKVGPTLVSIYGVDWERRLEAKELQANFVHLSILSKYYKREYEQLFKTSEMDDQLVAPNANSSHPPSYYRFGWLLFLALRVHAFSRFKDMITSTNGLVSILAILIIHVPIRFRNFTVQNSSIFAKRSDKGIDLLASLSNKYNTSEDELKKMMEKVNELIVKVLNKKAHSASDSKAQSLEDIDPDGLSYFEDLFEESSLPSSVIVLEKAFDDATWKKGVIDERVFINFEDSLLGSGSLSGGAINISGAKRKFDSVASPTKTITSPLSPSRSPTPHANGVRGVLNTKMPATPVSTAMTTAKWLRTVISPLPSEPSAELQKFLSSCNKDLTNDVVSRAHIILEAIFPNNALGERCLAGILPNANLMDNVWVEQRKEESLKLYYRVLEAMCIAEAQLLNVNNLTSLLTNERFHRCMLACSAELVLATHKTVTMLFPAVLEKTGITAFDLSKVIESFIRHEDSLPRELRRHLNSLEEKLLESMVWEKGSSMYNSLIIAKPALSAEINRLGLLAEPMPSLDAIAMQTNISTGGLPSLPSVQKRELLSGQNGDPRSPKRLCTEYRSALVERNSFTSPVKDRASVLNNKPKSTHPALQSAFASPTRPNPGGGGETCAETGINIFFSKIVKLAAVRINGMVERLQLSQQLRESVYCLFQQVLNQRTSLFFNHHIDQIILCCFYGVAKISQLNLTFKKIICNYRMQPQCKPQVFRSVFVDWSLARRTGRSGQDHVDIITFYNDFFIPTAKPLLVDLGPAGAATRANQVPEINNKDDGACPASPKLSPFPSLPDMSPKKVSAVHNVYVSPLRSSKRDALISHSSRSYYACVGESTHAYQSPSKDLTAINDRLNSGARKVRGALNFDEADAGLVSDSLVAKSLYLQNGNGASLSASAAAPRMKTEQPDPEN